jgi:ABC-2 type transport system permease protein
MSDTALVRRPAGGASAHAAPLVVAPAPMPPRALATDVRLMVSRCVRLSSRNIDAMITSLMLPILLMLLFVYLFGGAINTGTHYVTYVVPGVILLCAGFGSASTAVSVTQDLKGGIIDRFRSLDVGATALLGGHVVASVVRNLASTTLVLGVALAIGFRPRANALQWLAAAAVLLLFVLAISWLAAVAGLIASSPEAASGFTFMVMFLPYPSSAFVPIATMPGWLHGFARNQPCTPVIETLRGLLLDRPVGHAPWLAVLWCGGLIAVSVAASAVLFRRHAR